MSVILQNVDDHLYSLFSLRSEHRYLSADAPYNVKECLGLFVDWIPTNSDRAEELVQQTEIIEEFIRHNRKILIFDRYRSMTSKEFNYLKRHKVTFWEPALLSRKGFQYQPCWVDVPYETTYFPLEPFEGKKTYDLGFKGSLRNKFKGLSAYYEGMPGIMDLTIGVDVSDMKNDKIRELQNKHIGVGNHEMSDFKVMVLLGKPEDYVTGYLDPSFVECINQGVVPVLPSEHKWYYAMFEGLVIKNLSDLKQVINQYDNAGYGMTWELLMNIEKHHPEMTSSYVVHKVGRHFNTK